MKRRLAVLLALVILVAGWRLLVSLGHILYTEDTLAKADVIYVLAGTRVERVAEAAELYRAGWAPLILLSRQISEPAENQLRATGINIPTETDLQRDVLRQMGVPPDAISEVTSEQVSTSNEVDELVQVATARGWDEIIVVTSKLHTSRARLVMRRHLQPLGKQVIMRASRYDDADVDRWWSNRSDLRFVIFEAQKLIAYAIGVGD